MGNLVFLLGVCFYLYFWLLVCDPLFKGQYVQNPKGSLVKEKESIIVGGKINFNYFRTSDVMENGSDNFLGDPNSSTLEILQKEHDTKTERIHVLKNQIKEVKRRLEENKNDVPKDRIEATKNLSEKYKQLRDEYNLLLGQKQVS